MDNPNLSNLNINQNGKIIHIYTKGQLRKRLMDLGLIEGTTVKCVGKSPLGDPVAYSVRGTVIALRNSDASNIKIIKIH